MTDPSGTQEVVDPQRREETARLDLDLLQEWVEEAREGGYREVSMVSPDVLQRLVNIARAANPSGTQEVVDAVKKTNRPAVVNGLLGLPDDRAETFVGQMTWPCVCGHPKSDHYFGDGLDAQGQMHSTCQRIDGCGRFKPASGTQEVVDRLADVLVQHYVTAIDCDHDAKTDTVRCNCSVWTGTPQPSVGAAVRQWADHVLSQVRP